jgi:hypothetical protein
LTALPLIDKRRQRVDVELVVSRRHAGLVAEALVDVEGLLKDEALQ